jgi:hypothetical protein
MKSVFRLLSLALVAAVVLQPSLLLGQGSAASIVKEYKNGLAFVQGKTGQGSGFITILKGQKYLLSNAHVVAGVRPPKFTLLDRTPVGVGSASAAVGHDIVAVTVLSGGTPIPAMESVETESSIGDAVVVLGNAEGAGVVNLLEGRIVGIGPNLVEVDAPFVPGNSGSPIIHIRSGKVIGIATYLTMRRSVTGGQSVRRFGYRLDSVQKWQAIDWTRFYAEADAMAKIEKTSEELGLLLSDLVKAGRPTRLYTSAPIRAVLDTFEKAQRSGMQRSEVERTTENLLSGLRAASVKDVREATQRVGYDFFRRQLEDEEKGREEVFKVLDQAVKAQRK